MTTKHESSRRQVAVIPRILLALAAGMLASCGEDSTNPMGPGPEPEIVPSGWIWQNPWPFGGSIEGVWFAADGLFAVGVGDDGTVLRTTDAGSSWQLPSSGTSEMFRN